MVRESGCAAVVRAAAVPLLPEAERLLEDHGVVPNSGERNYFELAGQTDRGRAPMAARFLLSDPQTSGGLLLSAAPPAAERFLGACAEQGQFAAVIGEVRAGTPGHVRITS